MREEREGEEAERIRPRLGGGNEMEKNEKVVIDMSKLILIRIKFFKTFVTKLKERYPDIDIILDKLEIEYSIDNDKDIMQMVFENVYGGM